MKEIHDKELEKVVGGSTNTSDNPKGLKPGDSVYFFYQQIGDWMWGTFLYYDGQYIVRWNDTKIIVHGAIQDYIQAGETSVPEGYIK